VFLQNRRFPIPMQRHMKQLEFADEFDVSDDRILVDDLECGTSWSGCTSAVSVPVAVRVALSRVALPIRCPVPNSVSLVSHDSAFPLYVNEKI
jgi:hypothetical protein